MWCSIVCRWCVRLALLLCALVVCASSALAVNQNANMTETLTTTASVTALKNCHPAPAIETNVTLDSVKASTKRGNMTETVSESDSVVTGGTHVGSPVETLTTTDSCTAARHGCTPVGIIETNVTLDVISGSQHATIIQPSENLTLTVSVAAQAGHAVSMSESLTTTASVTDISSQHVSLSQTLTTSETCNATKPGNCQPVSIIETHPTADSISQGGSPHPVNVTEVSNLTVAVTAVVSHVGSMSESLTTADSLLVTHCGTLLEQLATLDALGVTHQAVAKPTENLTTSAALARSIAKLLAETLTTTDSINAQQPGSFSVNTNTTLSTTDSLSGIHAGQSALSESHSTSDSLSGVHTVLATPQEFLTASDSIAIQPARNISLTENLSTSEQFSSHGSGGGAHSVTLTENATESDAVSVIYHFSRQVVETKTTTDAVSTGHGYSVAVSESVSAADIIAESWSHLVSVFENQSVIATVSIVSPQGVGMNEERTATDGIVVLLSSARHRRVVVIDSQ